MNVEIQLQLRMDDNHLWIVNVAFVMGTCQLEVNGVMEDGRAKFIWQRFHDFGGSLLNVLICDD